jgi:hypothetical protein
MMNRTAKSQTQRAHIVQVVVNHLAQKGYRNIPPSHTQPALAKRTKQDHMPDVSADGVIIEVETADTIENDHTTSQCSFFSNHATKTGEILRVVVPNGCVVGAQNQLNALRLTGVAYGV